MIEIQNVIFDYPTKRALRDISLVVERGSVTALIGPNGAGKTTLMRCIAALETPLSGQVLIDGQNVTDKPRLAVGRVMLLQDEIGLYRRLTVEQSLAYALAAHRIIGAAARERMELLVGRLDLRSILDKRTEHLSRGQRQRVAIAQAIAPQPPVLLLDEPAAGLDPEARAALARLIRQLSAQGVTLIVSSHILTELQDYSTHVLILEDGRVVDHAPLADWAQEHGALLRSLRLELAAPVTDAAQRLAALPGVAELAMEDGTDRIYRLTFHGDLTAQAELLGAAIAAGLPVASLSEPPMNLQDRYLERIQAERVPSLLV